MELRDLIVTPIVIILICASAYKVRPYVTDSVNRSYFLPALMVKLVGALILGVVYQYYYGGGDTFMYHTYGSRLIWNAFMESPSRGIDLMMASSDKPEDVYRYASQIYLFRDPNSYAVIKLATLFDLFTFSTYSATACLFAVLSFVGSWQFYLTFYKQYPYLHRSLAIAAFFIPSVFFWGSGIMKDSVTLACLGIATYQFYGLFIERKFRIGRLALLLLSLYFLFIIRIFILQAYLPAAIIWIGAAQIHQIRSITLRILVVPLLAGLLMISGYYSVMKIGEDDERYALSKITTTARITAYDIRYWTGRNAGSGYTLKVSEWTPMGMVQAAPAAVNVALFRPYLWEVKNPLMLIASFESTALLILTLLVLGFHFRRMLSRFTEYNVLFCLAFALVLAFAVGISTFNFGTLMRYKIPLLPFYAVLLILLSSKPPASLAADEWFRPDPSIAETGEDS